MIDHPLHVIVKFGSDIPGMVQARALLNFEKDIRSMMPNNEYVEVFKDSKGDDSKLRSLMTPAQRAKL